jgi:glycosyltransferase involved in cell wall biosynthesis
MKIIFDLRNVGLGNNGGSSTLIKSGNALVDLGHEVTFIDSGKNQHTWTPLKADHIKPKNNTSIPSADFIIATGYKSVASTIRAPGRLGHKVHWIRGWETWQMPEKRIVDNILKAPTIKLVNSICLKKKLKSYKVESKIIRPGYDLQELFVIDPTAARRNFTLGGLYPHKKHWEIKRIKWIFETYKYLEYKYGNIDLWMFGNDVISGRRVDKYFHRPDLKQKNYFYNNIDIWLSPAMQEGLHIPPAEAMMTECPVVGTKAFMSGTEDYLFNGRTGLIADDNYDSFEKTVDRLYNSPDLRKKMGKNARKMIEKLGDRKSNMRKLIKYFKGIIE